jgi:hypothetical protein
MLDLTWALALKKSKVVFVTLEISPKSSKIKAKPPKTKNRPTLIAKSTLFSVNKSMIDTEVNKKRNAPAKAKTMNP